MSRMVIFRNIDDPRPPLTRERVVVGLVTASTWYTRFAKVEGEYGTLDLAVDATLVKWKATPPEKSISESFAVWLAEFAAFKKEWGDFKNHFAKKNGWTSYLPGVIPWLASNYTVITDEDDALLQTFEKRIFVLRQQYDKLTAVVVPPVPPTPPYEPPSGTVSSTVSSIADIAKWAAIGIVGFMALKVATAALPAKKG